MPSATSRLPSLLRGSSTGVTWLRAHHVFVRFPTATTTAIVAPTCSGPHFKPNATAKEIVASTRAVTPLTTATGSRVVDTSAWNVYSPSLPMGSVPILVDHSRTRLLEYQVTRSDRKPTLRVDKLVEAPVRRCCYSLAQEVARLVTIVGMIL